MCHFILKRWLFFSLCVLLKGDSSEFSVVVGLGPVQASAGEDVVLPCHLEPPFDVTTLVVEWTMNRRIVHVYTNRKHDHPQDEQFRGRTSMFPEEMSRGNISLKLTNVTEVDSGLYSCYVPRLNSQVKRGKVNLTVNPRKESFGGDNETVDDQKEPGVNWTGVIAAIVVVLIIAVSAVIALYCIKRRGRHQGNDPQGEPQNHEQIHLNPDPDQNPQDADAQ